MNSNFSCSYMTMSSLTYILGFSVLFFQPVYFVQKYYEIKITSKSFAHKFELKLSLGCPLSKLCVTPPFSINFRCQIENQVSDYRLLRASSFGGDRVFFIWTIACLLSFFPLVTVLAVQIRITDFDQPFSIFKLLIQPCVLFSVFLSFFAWSLYCLILLKLRLLITPLISSNCFMS